MDDSNNTPVDDQFLQAMGLTNLTEEEKEQALGDILYTLNMRVGMRISELLTEEQLEEFEQLSQQEPLQEELAGWLANNVAHYSQILEEEAQKMKDQNQETVKKALE